MGFVSGSISFRRFIVAGEQPAAIDQALLDKVAEFALQVGEFSVPDEVEFGWSGGRHVLDASFSFEHNVFADALHCAMRVDTNRVPGELKKAYQMLEEEALAAGNPSGFISKNQRRDAKETVRTKVEKELKSGRFRRSKLLPVLWDFPGQTLYCNASSSMQEKLLTLFERSFGLQLEPLTAGSMALRLLEDKGKRRDYEDFRPTRFVSGPEGEGQQPEYPWVAKGPQPKDFLGNEFLLWLWHEADAKHGTIKTDDGEVAIVLDKQLDLDCAYGQSGKDSLRGDGPTRMPEARDALRSGKLPRRAGMVMEHGGVQYTLTLSAEALAIGSAKLPDVEEAEDARVLFEERIAMLRNLSKGIDALFGAFVKLRASAAWEGQVAGIRQWITRGAKVAVA